MSDPSIPPNNGQAGDRKIRFVFLIVVLVVFLGILYLPVSCAYRMLWGEDRIEDVTIDYEEGDFSICTAIQIDRRGIAGYGRRYIVMVQEGKQKDRVSRILYTGQPLYPDAPSRPLFVEYKDGVIVYDDEGDRVELQYP